MFINVKKIILFIPTSFALIFAFSIYIKAVVTPYSIGLNPMAATTNGCKGGLATTSLTILNYEETSCNTTSITNGKFYFSLYALSTGYYNIRITKTWNGPDFNVNILDSSLNVIDGRSGGYYIDLNDKYFSKDSTHYIEIDNTNLISYYTGNITIEITRYDDNKFSKPYKINGDSRISSKIDYNEDVDYYTFDHYGGIYDIYSSNSDVDLKVELYLCISSSSCHKKVTYNDDYSFKANAYHDQIFYQEMGMYDFGIRIPLSNPTNTVTTYQLRVYQYNKSDTGDYKINFIRFDGKYPQSETVTVTSDRVEYKGEVQNYYLSKNNYLLHTVVTINPNSNVGHIKTSVYWTKIDLNDHFVDIISITWDGDYISDIGSTIKGSFQGMSYGYSLLSPYHYDSNVTSTEHFSYVYNLNNNSDIFCIADDGITMKVDLPLNYGSDKWYRYKSFIITLETDFILYQAPNFTYYSNYQFGASYAHLEYADIDLSIGSIISLDGPNAILELKIKKEHIIISNDIQFLIDPSIRNY